MFPFLRVDSPLRPAGGPALCVSSGAKGEQVHMAAEVMVLELVPKGWLQVLNMEGAEGGA